MKKLIIREIADEIELQTDELDLYLNLRTGKIHGISDELISHADDPDFDMEDLPDWQTEDFQTTKDLLENPDNYIMLPKRNSRSDYDTMISFIEEIEDEKIRDDFFIAVDGTGAFRMFRHYLEKYDLTDKWYKFRDNALRQVAIDWCRENNLPYSDEKP